MPHPECVERGPGGGHGGEARQPHQEEGGQAEHPGDGEVGVGARDQEQGHQRCTQRDHDRASFIHPPVQKRLHWMAHSHQYPGSLMTSCTG